MGYLIRKANISEAEQNIKSFWKSNFEGWPAKKFDWFYLTNPAGLARCWFINLEDNTNQIAGTTALFPRSFYFDENYVQAGITGDFGVDKNHRIFGPALKIQKTLIGDEADNFKFFYGFPNKNSEPVQKRAGFKQVGTAYRYVKVLKADEYIKRKSSSILISTLVSPLVNFYLNIFTEHRKIKKPAGLSWITQMKFDEKFDVLWEQAKKNHILIGERTSRFLHWRVASCPYIEYQIFALETQQNDLLGYVVYYLDGKTVHIADCLAADLEQSTKLVLAEFIRFAFKRDWHSISVLFLGNNSFIDSLQSLGFSRREDTRNVVAFTQENSELEKIIFAEQNWYFFEVDND